MPPHTDSHKNEQNLVDFFREAAPYIHMHRGKTFVIALSGDVLQHESASELLSDIALLSTLGARIVLVHGARPQIEKKLADINHGGIIHNGLRITDEKTLEISKAAIGATRLEIENHLSRALNRPPVVNNSLGVVSGNFLTARPVGVIDGIDHLHTGKVRKVNHQLLKQLLKKDNIVLLSPLGYSPTGQIYNLLFEEIAGFTARKLKADKLIFIHTDFNLSTLPRYLNIKQLDTLQDSYGEQLSKQMSSAIDDGVERVHLIEMNAQSSGDLLLELYTRDGVGSMVDGSCYDEPRKASIEDVSGILELIQPLEAEGVLAKRSREQLELDIDNFSVIERDGKVIGCAALYVFEGTHSKSAAELACLTIDTAYRQGNRGVAIVNYVVKQAAQQNISSVFVLTTQSVDWFKELGFLESEVDELPDARRKAYNPQRMSKILILKLR